MAVCGPRGLTPAACSAPRLSWLLSLKLIPDCRPPAHPPTRPSTLSCAGLHCRTWCHMSVNDWSHADQSAAARHHKGKSNGQQSLHLRRLPQVGHVLPRFARWHCLHQRVAPGRRPELPIETPHPAEARPHRHTH